MSESSKTADCELAKLTKGAPLCSEDPLFNITTQGDWYYRGERLPNKFARLFSSILHCIDGQYYLITPAEKLRVMVADAALIIVGYEQKEHAFLLDSALETKHKVENVKAFELNDEGIFLELERGLKAKLGRACYYRFINQFIISEN
ncbi:protein of unknown function DUF1285 [Shewanella sediminis HAW-EB3]|uniref:DUF1285 domain-containing protein n=1 Tax=Shewanella sediminis (strain HAW-EB3) TaxID=425104 RepID=A8FUG1_SHESH|nr:DUF1285 domain-containing protein [Shewanella sediminis]ABV36484.1 protein of unknown function DUF1285 [Shewanella sediminis HAW-EB3]